MGRDKKDMQGYESYPKDAYDNPPSGPVGVHRGARSTGARVAPFIVVLVVAVFAALIFWVVFSGQAANMFGSSSQSASQTTTTTSAAASSSTASSSSATSSESASATDTESATPSESATDEATATEEATDNATDTAGTVNYGTAISVINGTSIQGYASQEASKLSGAGFTDVSAGNPSSGASLPDSTVVWYSSDDDLATAQEVASALGIGNVAQANISVPVMVVLMN